MRHIASRGYVSEVFESIQGEGLYAGMPQVFVRLIGCNVLCNYCDTKYALKLNYTVKLGNKKTKNPVSVREVLKSVRRYEGCKSVSITGGEPLMQPEFAAELSVALKKFGYSVHLETNGTLPGALKKVVKYVDVIAADLKLPSATGRAVYWNEHKRFLKIAGKKAFLKIIITPKTVTADIVKALKLAERSRRNATVIIQPSPEMKFSTVLKLFAVLRKKSNLMDLRFLPQLHKLVGIK